MPYFTLQPHTPCWLQTRMLQTVFFRVFASLYSPVVVVVGRQYNRVRVGSSHCVMGLNELVYSASSVHAKIHWYIDGGPGIGDGREEPKLGEINMTLD